MRFLITADEIKAIEKLAAEASVGPWRALPGFEGHAAIMQEGATQQFAGIAHFIDGHENLDLDSRDAEFIAHAREDIPKLLAYIENLEITLEAQEENATRLEKKLANGLE